jgi:YVTN family beta-propeller protein
LERALKMKRTISFFIVFLLLSAFASIRIQLAKATGTIYTRADGTIDPPTKWNNACGLYPDSPSSVVQTVASGSSTEKRMFAVATGQFVDEAHIIDLSVEPPLLETSVAVGDQPIDVAITPDNGKALVSNVGDSTISVINMTADPPAVCTTVPVTGYPEGLDISPEGTLAIVGYKYSTHVSILDLTVDPPSVAYDIEISDDCPYAVGITPDGRYAIVGSGGGYSGTASVIDLMSVPPAEIHTMSIGRFPIGMAMDPTGKTAVITSIIDNNVSIIDLTTSPFSLKATISVGNNPGSEPDISSDGKYAVVANSDDATASIIDLTMSPPAVVATLSVGYDPRGVAIIDKDNMALVANRGSSTITRIDLNTLTVNGSFYAGSSPNRIALGVRGLIHDVAVSEVTPSQTSVGHGYNPKINVTVANRGNYTETFNVTVYANTTTVKTQETTLTSGNFTTITFAWNTTGFALGNYTISAYAWPVLGETDIADNMLTDRWVFVSIPGDINGDRKVDLKDVFAVGKAFGTTRQGPNPPGRVYVPNCDINDDDNIDLKDYYTTCKNFGKSW